MQDHNGLSRTLHSRHVAMISLGGIIGAGLFVGSSAAIAAIGPAVIVSYLGAGVLILLSMRMLGELALAHPEVGFFTDYARKVLGPGFGFVGGWLYWYFWMIVVAVEAIAGAIIIAEWIALPVWLIGLVLLICLTVVNLFSARSYGEFEFWFSSIKVAAILAFILVTGGYLLGFAPEGSLGFANLYLHGGFAPFGPLTAVAWNTIQPGTSPFVAALNKIGTPGAGLAMNIVVLTAVLSCLNSGLYVTSRVLFALAAKGDAPQALVKLNARKVPARAILTGSAFGYAALIASVVSPSGVFSFLVNASGAAMLILYLMIGAAQIQNRRTMTKTELEKLPLRMWLFPYLSYATEAGILAVLIAMAFYPDLSSQLVLTLAFTAFLWLAYALLRRASHAGSHVVKTAKS